jgi:hypothetical protein
MKLCLWYFTRNITVTIRFLAQYEILFQLATSPDVRGITSFCHFRSKYLYISDKYVSMRTQSLTFRQNRNTLLHKKQYCWEIYCVGAQLNLLSLHFPLFHSWCIARTVSRSSNYNSLVFVQEVVNIKIGIRRWKESYSFSKKKKQSLCYYNGLMCLFLPCFYLARARIDSYYCTRFSKRRKRSLLCIMKHFTVDDHSCTTTVVYLDMNTSLLMFHVSFYRASAMGVRRNLSKRGARLDSKRNVAIGESVKLVCSFNRRVCCCMNFWIYKDSSKILSARVWQSLNTRLPNNE